MNLWAKIVTKKILIRAGGLLFITGLALFAGCGVKTPPVPPDSDSFVAIEDSEKNSDF